MQSEAKKRLRRCLTSLIRRKGKWKREWLVQIYLLKLKNVKPVSRKLKPRFFLKALLTTFSALAVTFTLGFNFHRVQGRTRFPLAEVANKVKIEIQALLSVLEFDTTDNNTQVQQCPLWDPQTTAASARRCSLGKKYNKAYQPLFTYVSPVTQPLYFWEYTFQKGFLHTQIYLQRYSL